MTLTESPLTTRARQLLAAYPDAEILVSQVHTTTNEGEILARLSRVQRQLMRECGCTINYAQSAVVKILHERRKAARKDKP